jgi:hypothetical protein
VDWLVEADVSEKCAVSIFWVEVISWDSEIQNFWWFYVSTVGRYLPERTSCFRQEPDLY